MNKYIISTLLIAFCLLISQNVKAQDYNFGIRAGLNYSKFQGPQLNEADHKDFFSFNNGIHFGVTFAYAFTDQFGLRTEVGYNQIGTKYTFESEDAVFVFRNDFEREPRNGKILRKYDINNSYIHVPIMAYFKPFKKLELYGGIYTQFLILPTMGGSIDFTDPNLDDKELTFSFIQSIEGNYYADKARQAKGNQALTVAILVDGEVVKPTMNRLVGAYYELDEDEKKGSAFSWFDAGLEGGASYFVNKSLYIGLTGQYGLLDVTRNQMDVDFYRLDENQKFKFRSDYDVNFSLQLSVGFKF